MAKQNKSSPVLQATAKWMRARRLGLKQPPVELPEKSDQVVVVVLLPDAHTCRPAGREVALLRNGLLKGARLDCFSGSNRGHCHSSRKLWDQPNPGNSRSPPGCALIPATKPYY